MGLFRNSEAATTQCRLGLAARGKIGKMANQSPTSPDPERVVGLAEAKASRTEPVAVNPFQASMQFDTSARPRLRSTLFKVGIWIIVLIMPIVLAVYYGWYASPRYVSKAQFTVRASTAQVALPDVLATSAGLPSTGGMLGAFQDGFVVREFIHSTELVDRIDRELDLTATFAKDNVDWWSALPEGASREEKHAYWQWRVSADMDAASGLVRLKVAAFSPEDALNLTNAILAACQELVNRLSEQARRDALVFAEEELEKAEERLRKARAAVTRFRNASGDLFPDETAKAQLEMIARLEFSLVEAKAELAARGVEKGGPASRAAVAKIQALQTQIGEERAKLTSTAAHKGSGDPLSEVIIQYQAVQADRVFAEEFYMGTLSLLESARQEASKTQRYLVTFVRPVLPQEPSEPRRVWAVLAVIGGSLASLIILGITYKTVREHVV